MEMCWHCWRLVLCRWRGVCAWKRPSDVWVGRNDRVCGGEDENGWKDE